jgi:hypothetical protein
MPAKVGDINVNYESALGGGGEQLKIETPEGKSGPPCRACRRLPVGRPRQGGRGATSAPRSAARSWKRRLAVGVSMLTILLYIAFRFEFGFGVGAMVSTLHDILMTIGIFVLTGHKFSAPMVAAILCIAGYSINETVVVFDRIREELKLNPTGSLRDVINTAINKVFARTIMTSSTTFLAALSLYLFGSGVLKRHLLHLPRRHRDQHLLGDLHRRPGLLLVAQGRPQARRGPRRRRPEVRVDGFQQGVAVMAFPAPRDALDPRPSRPVRPRS